MCYSNNGENMKSDIIYSNDMLLVNLEGNLLKKAIVFICVIIFLTI